MDIIALDATLFKLASLDSDQAKLGNWGFFGGLSVEQIAEGMGVSAATVKRSWGSARAFLRHEIDGAARDA